MQQLWQENDWNYDDQNHPLSTDDVNSWWTWIVLSSVFLCPEGFMLWIFLVNSSSKFYCLSEKKHVSTNNVNPLTAEEISKHSCVFIQKPCNDDDDDDDITSLTPLIWHTLFHISEITYSTQQTLHQIRTPEHFNPIRPRELMSR